MTQLEIALKLREQIKEQWPFVSTILALYENNINGQFTERIQDMVDRLLPKEVFYYTECEKWGYCESHSTVKDKYLIVGTKYIKECFVEDNTLIESLPINQVLFASVDNPKGKLE
jgi:hypothetical protein